jgi:hypothetical protein
MRTVSARAVLACVVALACVAVGIVVAASEGTGEDSGSKPERVTGQATHEAPLEPYIRDCDVRWGGRLHPDARRRAIGVGPVSILGAQYVWRDDADYFRPRDRHGAEAEYAPARLLVRLKGSRPATIAVPKTHRESVSMIFDARTWRASRPISDGREAVKFMPCDGSTNVIYDGAFIVAGRQCVPLEFSIARREPVTRTVSFGAGKCD